MTDDFIIKELQDQKKYWQKEIQKRRNKVTEAEDELARCERLLYVMGSANSSSK